MVALEKCRRDLSIDAMLNLLAVSPLSRSPGFVFRHEGCVISRGRAVVIGDLFFFRIFKFPNFQIFVRRTFFSTPQIFYVKLSSPDEAIAVRLYRRAFPP